MLSQLIQSVYGLLWGDFIVLPLGPVTLPLSLMAILLFTAGVYFTIRTRLLPVRLFRDMVSAVGSKKPAGRSLSSFQTLVVSTATRVGMGNLVGVVAAVSAGGAGAVFWMWLTALLGASTAFVESTLAQKYKQPDPLYGGYRGGPAYYIHKLAERKRGKALRRSVVAALFAVSGLICWCGISQVISNSVSEAFYNAFSLPKLGTTVVLVVLAAVIVLRKDATIKSLDVMVPVMAGCYFVITLYILLTNLPQLPAVFSRIFSEAFGLRQVVAGGFGAVVMNGVQRGLFSNEAGSGSAPCAAAAAECSDPVQMGLVQSLGVLDRHHCYLQLHGFCDAAGTGVGHRWPAGYGLCCRRLWSITWAALAASLSRLRWHCSAFLPSWAFCSTPGPTCPICAETAGGARRHIKCWPW